MQLRQSVREVWTSVTSVILEREAGIEEPGSAARRQPQPDARLAPNRARDNSRRRPAQFLITRIQKYKHFPAIFNNPVSAIPVYDRN